MPLYIGDYLGDTSHLSTLEHGAYLLLLMAMWRAGGKLPNDDKRLARLAQMSDDEWAEIKATIREFFSTDAQRTLLFSSRLVREYGKYGKRVEGAKQAGIASAKKRSRKINGQGSTDVGDPLNRNPTNQNQNQRDSLAPTGRETISPPKPTPLPAEGQAPASRGMDHEWVAAQIALLKEAEG